MWICSWLILILALSIGTFGVGWTFALVCAVVALVTGILAFLYQNAEGKTRQYVVDAERIRLPFPENGLEKLKSPPKEALRSDRRLTGSNVIDDSLQEILGYIFRDYVVSWYGSLSDDPQFLHHLRESAQKVLVVLAARIKDINWIPYLTTRLVDDAATHLRLYRQAREKLREKNREEGANNTCTLEQLFFELEKAAEPGSLSRRSVCLNQESEQKFLQELAQVLLYLLLPESDFHCKPVRLLTRELLVNVVVLPLMKILTDPDYINQIIMWLCRDFDTPSEVFLSVLRVTDNIEELHATRELVKKEIAQLRSRDSGGEDDTQIKQQLRSLQYLLKVIGTRAHRLQEGVDTDSAGLPSQLDWNLLLPPGQKLFSLPLDVILRNGLALSYFMDYMANIDAMHYLFFYLTVDGWKVSAEQQLSAVELEKETSSSIRLTHDNIREYAISIYDQYLSEKASPRVNADESALRRLAHKLREESVPVETWFDEVQSIIYERLMHDEIFLPSFRRSHAYVRLLAELDLLKDSSKSDDEDSASLDDLSLADSASLSSLDIDTSGSTLADERGASPSRHSTKSSETQPTLAYSLQVEVFETGVVQDHGKTYGIYAVSVTRKYETSPREEKWHVYRRYSDFYDLFQKVKTMYPGLSQVPFPAKRTFNNTDRPILEHRMRMLHNFLQSLLKPSLLHTYPLLQDTILHFLQGREYDRGRYAAPIGKKLDNLVRQSVRSVSHAVRTMPENLISTMDGMMDGLSRALSINKTTPPNINDFYDTSRGGAIDPAEDNIPLRVMLLLMDEVFDLKSRNQWLRRRIVAILRQIIKSMFGDIVNRRIVEYVADLTSPDRVAEYLRAFKNMLWPSGSLAMPNPPRDEATKMRTRVAAKAALLASLTDELRHILGNETTRRGMLIVFELFQQPVLNKRLLYVLIEGVLVTLFPANQFPQLFTKLHAAPAPSLR